MKVARTAVNADGQTVLTSDPDAEAYTNTYVERALEHAARPRASTSSARATSPIEVTLNPGGA